MRSWMRWRIWACGMSRCRRPRSPSGRRYRMRRLRNGRTAMTDEVKIAQQDDGVLEIVLNRPEQGNALTPAMAKAIMAALEQLDTETRVVLLRAVGPDFCTGRSGAMPGAGSRATALDLRGMVSDPVLNFYA